jgi:hypothetical protein
MHIHMPDGGSDKVIKLNATDLLVNSMPTSLQAAGLWPSHRYIYETVETLSQYYRLILYDH